MKGRIEHSAVRARFVLGLLAWNLLSTVSAEAAVFHCRFEALLYAIPTLNEIKKPNELHRDISNDDRHRVIADVPLAKILSAPGHQRLRDPKNIIALAKIMNDTPVKELAKRGHRIVLNVYTAEDHGQVSVLSIEAIDGNHRLAAGLYSGKWKTIGDIPESLLEVRVNGNRAQGAGTPPHWIPLATAERSKLVGWTDVSKEDHARGPTAEIPPDIPSFDSRFAPEDRGLPLSTILQLQLGQINGAKPEEGR